MDKISSIIIQKWHDIKISGEPGEYIRVDADGALAQYCGVSATGGMQLISISTAEPKVLRGTKVIKISYSRRADAKFVQLFELLDARFLSEFATLCGELFLSTKYSLSEEEALENQASSYLAWARFFQQSQTMTLESARGLFAELTTLENEVSKQHGYSKAISCWSGPLGGHQDFVIDGAALEVKSIHIGATDVKISSEHQLDFPGPLLLRVHEIEDSVAPEGETLVSVVNRIRSGLGGEVLDTFMDLLAGAAFRFDDPICSEKRFSSLGYSDYDSAQEGFPLIRANDLAEGVSKVKYNLSIARLTPFKVNND